MRSIVVLLLLSAATLMADLQWSTNYEQAFERANAQDKDVLILLSQDNCKACWYMENIVFEDEVLAETLKKSYIPLSLDIHDDDIHGLDYRGTPTLYFMTKEDKVILRLDGVYNIKELTAALLRVAEEKKEMTEEASD